eukprot:gene5136-biopygen4188
MVEGSSGRETQQRSPSSSINSFFQSYIFSTETPGEAELPKEASSCEDFTENSSKNSGGGITCCVPLCYNNSKRNKELQFYVIPKDAVLRKKWLAMISRKNFVPSTSHRVCSDHFEGGKKTYMNNIPTVVPKTIRPASNKPRCTRNSTGALRDPIVVEWTNEIVNEGEIAQVSKEQQLKSRVEQLLTTEIHKLRAAERIYGPRVRTKDK